MKRILACLLAAAMSAAFLGGCSAGDEPVREVAQTDSTTTELQTSLTVTEASSVTEAPPLTETSAETSLSGSGLDMEISSQKEENSDDKREKRTEITGDDSFTVMVYMCGTDLETDCASATDDILEMCEANISDKVNVLIYTGGTKEWQNSYISNETNQIWKVINEDIVCVEEDMGQKPMNDPDTLTEFVSYCSENFPSNRNALILWDHGGGALYGFGIDEIFGGSAMQINEIDRALERSGTKFDFIGFDACLMATVETACMIDNHADYMIASEELEPACGWYYTNWIDAISTDPSIPTEELGRIIVNDYVQVNVDNDEWAECTLSLIDLTEMNNVFGRLCDFSASAKDMLDNGEFRTVSRCVSSTKTFGDESDMIDLMHFARNLDIPESQALISAIDNAVVYSANSTNISNSNGLTIYLPYSDLFSFNSMMYVYNDLGLGGSFTDFVMSFANLMADGQSHGAGNDPMAALSGSDLIYEDIPDYEDWMDYAWFDEDYASSNDSSEDTLSSDSLQVEDRGDFYALYLSDEDWDIITDIRMLMFYDDGEGYIDMGTDDYFETDDDGALKVDFDGLWFSLGEYIVPLTITETEGFTQGEIECYLNGELVYLIARWDDNYNGDIIGARREYDSGVSMKGLLPVEDGDIIQLVCDYYTYNGDYEDEYTYGDPFEFDSTDMNVKYYPAGEGDYLIYYVITDIYNNKYYTEPVTLTFYEDYFTENYPEYY